MTATTSTPRPPAEGDRPPARRSAPAGVPFGRLLLVETRKLVDTRAGRGLLLAIALVTAATVALGIAKGCRIVRVHDVREMVRVARMTDAILYGPEAVRD